MRSRSACRSASGGRIDEMARMCEEEGKIVRIPMDVLEHALSVGRVEELDGMPDLSIVSGPDRIAGLDRKRASMSWVRSACS